MGQGSVGQGAYLDTENSRLRCVRVRSVRILTRLGRAAGAGASGRLTVGEVVTVQTTTDKIAWTRAYRGGRLEKEHFPVEDVSDYLGEPDTVVWVDLCAPTHEDLEVVARELGLHELALEDAVDPRQRPKLDRYATHEFLNMYPYSSIRARVS